MILLSGNLVVNNKKEIYLLYRKDHHFYETPGGKVKSEECKSLEKPSIPELEVAARRELLEEVSGIIKIVSMQYFAVAHFHVPDGREAFAHKFITKVEGNLSPREDNFDSKKSGWIKIEKLSEYPISSDLKMLLSKIKDFFN